MRLIKLLKISGEAVIISNCVTKIKKKCLLFTQNIYTLKFTNSIAEHLKSKKHTVCHVIHLHGRVNWALV